MGRVSILILFFLIISVSSCKKEDDNIIWEKSFVQGTALYLTLRADSGIVSCGRSDGSPYLILIDKNKNTVCDYKPDYQGLFSSAWSGDSTIIAAGSNGRKMLLSGIKVDGSKIWDTTLITDNLVDRTSLCYLGEGQFLAVGSSDPDSAAIGSSGLVFVWFDKTGTILKNNEITETYFVAVNEAVTDASGNIYLALTKLTAGDKTKASVTRYNDLLQKNWDKELYNNPSFGAASLGIALDNSNNIYVSGRTELSVSSGIEDNTFAAALSSTGTVLWKKYLEYANSGTSVLVDESGQPVVLNKNCIIVNTLNKEDGSVSGIIRTYRECDSQKTDTYGYSVTTDNGGDLLMAGSRGGRFYIALKSILSLSPV